MKTKKLVKLVEDLYRHLEFYDVEECDPDVADALHRAEKFLKANPAVEPKVEPVDTEFSDHLEVIRQANIHEMT